ncbi:MAG: HPr kinase/phosphatase C-terminal domain-containing protein [Pseudolabrys sp.]|jgi:serine kinase of HPr protein (carbohydrate metabolism regulator)
MAADAATIHASAVLIGPKAVLIRGPAGSGKSRLVWDLLQAAAQGALPFARLVADDRAYVEACAGRLLVRPAPALAGLLEIRGLGIRHLPYEPVAVVFVVVDLATADAARYPGPGAGKTTIDEVSLPQLTVVPGMPALAMVLAFLRTTCAGN